MKKIIVVRGVSSSGKSGSIRRFLKDQGVVMQRRGDFIITIRKRKRGIHTVGVASAGDTKAILVKNFNYLIARNCDIIVCASKSTGKTIAYVKTMAANHHAVLVEVLTARTLKPSAAAIIQKNALVAGKIERNIP